ncbi:hypothetical protein D3C72_776640 [compost metagenome]
MIGADKPASTNMRSALSPLLGLERLDPELTALAVLVSETIDDPSFPGALIPVVWGEEGLTILVAAQSQRDWRRLSPLLKAFAGPTLTSFSGIPEDLPTSLAAADMIRTVAPTTTAVLRIPSDHRKQVSALRALKRLRETIVRSPDLRRGAPEPTSWLLARLQDYLNMGRREPAERVLAQLRTEMRLDALNLAALEVQVLAASEDWAAIVNLPFFGNLCVARRTPATTAFLLEALYHVHIEEAFDREDVVASQARFESDVRTIGQAMLTLPVAANAGPGAWRILALEALSKPARQDLVSALRGRISLLGWLGPALETSSSPPSDEPDDISPLSTSLDIAREALSEVGRTESLDAFGNALAALTHLSAADLDRLRTAEPFRTLLQSVEADASPAGIPRNWTEWFTLTREPSFTSALDVARAGADEWSLEEIVSDPLHIQRFVSAIEESQNDALATDRASLALPFLIAWLRKDTAFPRPALRPIYSILLTLFILSPNRSRSAYESSYLLIHSLLASGLPAPAYRDLIADVRELAGDGFGVDMAYWLLEVVEDFMRAAAPDDTARTAFLHDVLSKLAPLYGRLSSFQRAAVSDFAGELGWSLQGLGVAEPLAAPAKADGLAEKLDGKRIAIYTLTESTSRQAKIAIERVAPGATVDCNADHGGSLKLRALAENSDLFVMVWQSAKHAATDFIREHRASKPLIYASGRGVSSILRAIEDHFSPV